MDGYGIQVSFKTGETLINVRGDDPTEFEINLSTVVEKIDDIRAAEAAFRPAPTPAAPPPDGLTQLQQGLGAQVIAEYPASPPPAYQQTHCDRCKTSPTCKTCNVGANVVPRSIKDGAYWIHDCPSGSRDHKGTWCNLPK